VTPGGTALGSFELAEDEAQNGAVIRRDGEPDRRVLRRLEGGDPELFEILIVERV
jgi:hypothetical protein